MKYIPKCFINFEKLCILLLTMHMIMFFEMKIVFQEPFIQTCVNFLKRRCPQLVGGLSKDENQPQMKSQMLPAETIATMLSCLQQCARWEGHCQFKHRELGTVQLLFLDVWVNCSYRNSICCRISNLRR